MPPNALVVLFIISAVSIKDLHSVELSRLKYPKITPRIISGKPADPGQFPWQVLIKRAPGDDVYCGGSVISEDWVLTAAHCVRGLNSIFMVFGTNKVNEQSVVLVSTEFYYHNEYNPDNFNNDIAVIKLPESLKFSETIKPVNLLAKSSANDDFNGKTGIVSGWGYTSDEDLDFSNILQFTFMKVITNKECAKVFGEDTVVKSTICAQGSSDAHESICSGDSGGAFVIDINGRPVQIGINSFVADQQCAEGYPAGFARVGAFLDFIQEKTGIEAL